MDPTDNEGSRLASSGWFLCVGLTPSILADPKEFKDALNQSARESAIDQLANGIKQTWSGDGGLLLQQSLDMLRSALVEGV